MLDLNKLLIQTLSMLFQLNKSDNISVLPQIFSIFAASLALLSHGMLFAWPSPATPQLLEDKSTTISLEDASYFAAISAISMAITAPFFPLLIDVVGRSKSILIASVPQVLAWICTLLSTRTWHFYVARVISGIGDAAVYATVPAYIGEISQPDVRGTWGNVPAIAVTVGAFLINLIGAYFSLTTMAMVSIWIPIIQIVCFWFMPDSPYLLLMKGNEAKAKQSLQLLRWCTNVERELEDLKVDVQRQTSESGKFSELFTIRSNFRALLICLLLRIAQQFSGLPAFTSFTRYAFENAGGFFSEKTSTLVYCAFVCLSYVISPFVIKKCKRKNLIMLSCISCASILSALAVYFYVKQYYIGVLDTFDWLPITGMALFAILGSLGLGTLPTLVVSELFSTSIKAKAVGIVNTELAIGYIVVPKLFVYLTSSIGIFAAFSFFAVCSCVCTIFAHFFVIETKGKTLEEIQIILKGK